MNTGLQDAEQEKANGRLYQRARNDVVESAKLGPKNGHDNVVFGQFFGVRSNSIVHLTKNRDNAKHGDDLQWLLVTRISPKAGDTSLHMPR